MRRLAVSGFVFAVVVGAVCLPFLLYSNDFWYMNLTYLENVPVQTQSWIVALLGVTRTAPDALTSDFFLLRYQMPVMLLAAIVAGALAVWRGKGLYWAAALIAILFFLTSRKVMGYYYVMLLPFLLVECLPTRRLTLVLAAVVATAWISLSPYYAAWGDPGHWWIYAALGTANSLFFVWLAVRLTLPETPMGAPAGDRVDTDRAREPVRDATVLVSVGLFAAAVFASFLQPLVQSSGSAIRAPLIAPGMEGTAATAFVALAGMILIALALATRATQAWGKRAGWAAWGAVLIFAPLFFAVYTLTKESTAVFEIALKALGG